MYLGMGKHAEGEVSNSTSSSQTSRNVPAKTAPRFYGRVDEIYDLQGAAGYLKKSRRWLRENCVRLGIEHDRIGRGFRFERAELDRFRAQYRVRGKKGVYV
jgi:hypothetical protein